MSKFNWILSVGVVLALLLGIIGLTKSQPSQQPPLGAVTGPDSYFPCETHNGFTDCFDKKVFNAASTTLASFISPPATSTLVYAAGVITTASTSALDFEWGRATVTDATTTTLGTYNISANLKAMVLASTTNTTVNGQATDLNNIIPPNTKVNFKYGGNLCPTTGGACNSLGGYAVVRFEY